MKPAHKIRGEASDAYRRGLEWRQGRLSEAYAKSDIRWLERRGARVADCGRFVGVRACVSDAKRSYCVVARCDDRQCQTCHTVIQFLEAEPSEQPAIYYVSKCSLCSGTVEDEKSMVPFYLTDAFM